MAIPSTAIFEVQNGGSDTLNGACFDTASTGKPTDLTTDTNTGNTSTPIVSSASYNFVSGDIGHWLYVQGGTNWTPGWYKITAVSSNKATLNAAVRAAVLFSGALNTVVGCATVGTPTNGTWAIDYSQVASVPFSLTGLTTSASNAIILTASATVAMVGNGIQITGGTNFTTGFYVVTAASAGVSLTVDRTCTTAAGAAGTAGLGGALATPSKGLSIMVTSSWMYIQYNATAYSQSANPTVNPSGVTPSNSVNFNRITGYNTLRGDNPTGSTRPTLKATSSCNRIFPFVGKQGWIIEYLILDGNSVAQRCADLEFYNQVRYVWAKGASVGGILFNNTDNVAFACEISGCAGRGLYLNQARNIVKCCYIHDNTGPGIDGTNASLFGTTIDRNIIYNNTGGTTDGLIMVGGNTLTINITNNIFANNGRDGIRYSGSQDFCLLIQNNIFISNGGVGINFTAGTFSFMEIQWDYNAYYNNTGGAVTNIKQGPHDITLTGSPFVSAGSDFSLNLTSGAGLACRAAGIPGAFPSSVATGYLDVGAVQHADPASAVMVPCEG